MIMENPKDSESLAIDILTFLTGISSRDGEKFPVLRKAIRAVTNSEERGLLKVIEELRVEGTPISVSIADHIESFTDYDFAHLLFSHGDVEQSISLEKQLNIIQVADLVLPDKETSFEEYTTMELLSVAMLIVISTFALDFIHTDRSIFKIVDLDEAWSFLQVAQGKTLSMKLVRAGRAMNAGVYFVTQNTDDLLDEKLKNNLGLKFAFRSTDMNEIKKTLSFFGVDAEDENNQNSDIESVGADRVESLLSTSPDTNNGEDREEIVVEEIEDLENTNLTVTKTINRLGMVFFLFIFNIGISVFVFLLTGIMIFSQVLFIIYAMFLPVSFILSMVPTFDGMSKRAITKLFNTILTRAGITLIITIAFSISTMLYTLSAGYPFFLIAFLQIVTFAGIYFKLGDLMSMFSLQSGDSQSVGSRIMRRPRMLMHAHMHRLQHKLGRSVAALGAGAAVSKASKQSGTASGSGASRTTQADHTRPDGQGGAEEKASFGKRAGQAAGAVMDTKGKIIDTAAGLKEQAKDLPVNAKYALYHGKTQVSEGVRDFTSSMTQTRTARAEGRKEKEEQRRKTIAERRAEMEQTKSKKTSAAEPQKTASPVHERPATTTPQTESREPMGRSQTQTARPAVQAGSAGKPTERPVVSSVKEKADMPAVEEKQAVKAETPPVRAERQIVKSNSQPAVTEQHTIKADMPPERAERQIVQTASHSERPLPKAAAPATVEQEPQRHSIKERSSTIKRESTRKEKSRTAAEVKKGEKK